MKTKEEARAKLIQWIDEHIIPLLPVEEETELSPREKFMEKFKVGDWVKLLNWTHPAQIIEITEFNVLARYGESILSYDYSYDWCKCDPPKKTIKVAPYEYYWQSPVTKRVMFSVTEMCLKSDIEFLERYTCMNLIRRNGAPLFHRLPEKEIEVEDE